jgi:uncharacterized hydrophobic protein (TIGR00271 family)
MENVRRRLNGFKHQDRELLSTQQVHKELLAESTLDLSFLVLVVSSCAIATFGLLANSAAVIIGAMIIAPLMLPIRGLAFGALIGDLSLVRRGINSLFWGTLLALLIACCVGWLTGISNFGSEVLARSEPTLLDLGVAVVAGAISAYAKAQPKISGSLAGTAIAVALMPPVCAIGLGLSQANWALSQGATLLYLTNLFGIALSCMLAFWMTGYAPLRNAGKVLSLTLVSTALLSIPLGFGFTQMVRQTRLEGSLESVLLNRTKTFQQLDLLSIRTNWTTEPPEVWLNVRAREPITPNQVGLLEDFLQREMGQRFELIFVVGQVEEVRREGSSLPQP